MTLTYPSSLPRHLYLAESLTRIPSITEFARQICLRYAQFANFAFKLCIDAAGSPLPLPPFVTDHAGLGFNGPQIIYHLISGPIQSTKNLASNL